LREAVIVSGVRTAGGKAPRGTLRDTRPEFLGALTMQEAIKRGVCCFNVDTSIRLAFINNLINSVKNQGNVSFDIRKLLGGAREAVKETVKRKLKFFGSDGKA